MSRARANVTHSDRSTSTTPSGGANTVEPCSRAVCSGSAYRYDLTGNRSTQTQNGLTIDYSYDALDQLLAVSSSTLTAQYTYTPNGTRATLTTPAATVSYAYDALDRLLSVATQPSMGTPTAHAFTYDADGRMVTSGSRQFLWDEASTYGDIVAEFDGGQLDASYVLGGSRLISQTTGADSAYFLTDALGSTRALSDGAASLTDTFTYDAYGGLYSSDPFADFSTTATPYLFTGHRYDSALGLYHTRARVYDPAVGRFLSRDTWPVELH